MKKKNNNSLYIKWVITVSLFSFFVSSILNGISNVIVNKLSIMISFILLIIVILLGVLFDIIGIAVTAANSTPFHAMASKKVRGAKNAIWLIKNASKVSSICNDVVGDICGIISGAIAASIIFYMSKYNFNLTLLSILLTAMVASLTITGKAIGKHFAISKSHEIVKVVGKILSLINNN